MAYERYPDALHATQIGSVSLRNRIFVPAHTTNYGENHLPSNRHLAYHEARARGGAGLIIFESIRVHPSSLGKPQGIAGYDPRCVEPFRSIADAVHHHGAKLFGQIIHLGRQIDGDPVRVAPWAPSAIPWDPMSPTPHVMDGADIAALIEGFVTSARHVLAGGLDGLEVHLGHGHLLQQFLSPACNEREDEYGGTEANRLRLSIEVLEAVRQAVGPDACLGIRVSADEFLPGGLGLADMMRIVDTILQTVPLDFVNVSHSAYHNSYTLATQIADMAFPVEPFRHLATGIRQAIRAAGFTIPVMAVCKFRTLAEADDMIASGGADLVGMARAHIADPNLVIKAVEEREHEIRGCIGCNQGCAGFLEKGLPITCLVNPAAGREATWSPEPARDQTDRRRKVLVIGGGPAGLEAAWVAAARGHQVELWERSDDVGGQLRSLGHLPLRNDFLGLIRDQVAACLRHGVVIKTGLSATPDRVARYEADRIVLATGSAPQPVRFPEGGHGHTLEAAIAQPSELGTRIAFFDGTGGWAAASVIEYLAGLGGKVIVFTPAATLGPHITRYSRPALLERLRRLAVEILPMRSIVRFENGTVDAKDAFSGTTESFPGFDSMVASGPRRAMTDLHSGLVTSDRWVTPVGDCVAPRTALEAVFEGHEAARAL